MSLIKPLPATAKGAPNDRVCEGFDSRPKQGPSVRRGRDGDVAELKAEGVIKAAYRRAAGPGVFLLLEGESVDAVRERMNTLPFVVEGLMTLEYDEIYEI